MKVTVDLTPADAATPPLEVADALFDFLCSMGEDPEAHARLDALIFSFDGTEPER